MDALKLFLEVAVAAVLILDTIPRVFLLYVAKKRIFDGKLLIQTWAPKGDLKNDIESELKYWRKLHDRVKFFWMKKIDNINKE